MRMHPGFIIILAIVHLAVTDPCHGPPGPAVSLKSLKPTFYGYTRTNKTGFILGSASEAISMTRSLRDRGFVKSGRQVVFIVHGFLDSSQSGWQSTVKDAILNADDSLVFIVDWSRGSKTPAYIRAMSNAKTAANAIANVASGFIALESNNDRSHRPYIHCIGQSLGAHVCYQAGRYSPRSSPGRPLFDRVTGLDPAGPGFQTCPMGGMQYSASCVDNIHTSGNSILGLALGTLKPWGHVDFYPNGGRHQPGCLTDLCNHIASISIFVDSIQKGRTGCKARGPCIHPNLIPQTCASRSFQSAGYYSSCYKGANMATGSFYLPLNANGPRC